MNLNIRIPQSHMALARLGLPRPHAFAYERVGFFRCRPTSRPDLIVVTGYDPVADEDYVRNSNAAACIGSMAIETAMQRILTHTTGQIHVHLHEHHGRPSPSPTDMENQPRLLTSFHNLDPQVPHGFIILSETHVWGLFAIPGQKRLVKLKSVSVVSGRVEFS